MAKIKLGNRPKNFKRTVSFPMLDGTTGNIEVIYKYRTRSEFGAFVDSIMDAAGERRGTEDDEKFSMEKLMERTKDSNADYVLQVIEGWNLEAELTRENVEQLADEIPAAVITIMETYRLACTEGRLGN